MRRSDRELGMDRPVTRRDFIEGVGTIAMGSLLTGKSLAAEAQELGTAPVSGAGDFYPPELSGQRGSQPGSFDVAHRLVLSGQKNWGAPIDPGEDMYDLVVVGAGISGLSAAYFFRERNPQARILILDNHDDFGGHSRRNEFSIDGRKVLSYGGGQTLENPGAYSAISKRLLDDLGVRIQRFETAYDHGFYRRHGLRGGIYFDRETYGVDRVVPYEILDFSGYLPLEKSELSAAEAIAKMPLSEAARKDLVKLMTAKKDAIPSVPRGEREEYLGRISYMEFLKRHMGVKDPDAIALLQGITTDVGLDFRQATAASLIGYVGLPNATAAGIVGEASHSPYIHHFPDGNASVARLLVRSLMPAVAPGETMEDIVMAPFDYGRLDDPGAGVRIRLNSTVVKVAHEEAPTQSKSVSIAYVPSSSSSGRSRPRVVRARACILAGYNSMIPHLCPEMPTVQREALSLAIKSPVVYTNVLLRNWKAWKKMGIGAVAAPGGYHANAMLDFPVSLGDYRFSAGPDEPIVVHMERFPKGADGTASPRDQYRAGRRDILQTSFESIERSVRTQLGGMLSEGGFDPAGDIAAITVNRWAHGYAYSYDSISDLGYDDGEYPSEVGRKRFGRIAVANSDAGALAAVPAAIEEAHRAVSELEDL
jgi:spermidine dehydrogenase